MEHMFDGLGRWWHGLATRGEGARTPSLAGMTAGWDDAERAALVALLRERPDQMTWQQIAMEVGERGSALSVWRDVRKPDLFDDGSTSPALDHAASDIAVWRATGAGLLTFLDADYPAQLREIHEIPPVLFYRGVLVPDEPAVSVVGSRAASEHGLEIARIVATGLIERGITVVSGLAKGIDTAAHVAALDRRGRTVAVIGNGINRCYPAENRLLQDRIARDGLVLSQFWPDAPPRPQQFPMRNAVMSGYGRATIVVEAGEKSGARIQARQAVAHGRPVVLTSLVVEANEWSRQLVGRPGVHVANGASEVLARIEEIMAAAADIDELLAAVY